MEFRVAGAIQAMWYRERFLTGMAWDAITAAVLLRAGGPPSSLLMLGLGGGAALRQLKLLVPSLQITALELDPGMIALGRKYMDVGNLNASIVEGDAYHWLRGNRRRFDVIVDDVYGSGAQDVSRPTVYTAELRAALGRNLAPGGAFVANLVTGPGHRNMQIAFRRFMRETFPTVRAVRPTGSLNEALVGGIKLRPPGSLRSWEDRWPHRKDQRLWRQLRCRTLETLRNR